MKNKPLMATRLLLGLLTLSLLPTALSMELGSKTIGSSGVIAYLPSPSPSGYFVYSGIETALPPSWEDGWATDIGWWVIWGSDYSIEQDTTMSKAGYASMKVTKGSGSERVVLLIDDYPWEDECYQSMWVYIPTSTPIGSTWWEWFELREHAYSSSALCIHIFGSPSDLSWWFVKAHQPGTPAVPTSPQWSYRVYSDTYEEIYSPSSGASVSINPHEVPRGRWFRWEFYVKRSTTDGIMKVWITDPEHPDPSQRSTKLLFSIENAQTSDGFGGAVDWEIAKHYGMVGTVWYDEIALYDYNAHQE